MGCYEVDVERTVRTALGSARFLGIKINMSLSAQQILTSFDQLSASDQQRVAAEILRRVSVLEWPPMSDEELTSAADQLFLALDEAEGRHGQDLSAR